MHIIPPIAVGLIALAVLLIWNHLRSWRAWAGRPMDAVERDYRTSKFRRRTHLASLLGMVGVVMMIGYFIDPAVYPRLAASVWLGVLLITLWMVGVAIFEVVETGRYVGRISRRR